MWHLNLSFSRMYLHPSLVHLFLVDHRSCCSFSSITSAIFLNGYLKPLPEEDEDSDWQLHPVFSVPTIGGQHER
jgi:hypothetical protein